MAMTSGKQLIKTLLFGIASVALYWGLITYSGDITHFAYGTSEACVVGQGADAQHFQKATAELCSAQGGTLQEGHWYYVLIPIVIAFIMSYVHGAFTGLFWDTVGLKAKK